MQSTNQKTFPKPPLGLTPKFIHDKKRIIEILDAMERYSYQRFPIPIEWVEELGELIIEGKTL